MAVVSAMPSQIIKTENKPLSPIATLQSDRTLLADDLQAGKSVSAVLVGIVMMGLLMMILTVLLSVKV